MRFLFFSVISIILYRQYIWFFFYYYSHVYSVIFLLNSISLLSEIQSNHISEGKKVECWVMFVLLIRWNQPCSRGNLLLFHSACGRNKERRNILEKRLRLNKNRCFLSRPFSNDWETLWVYLQSVSSVVKEK